ncbi:HNH endonuclease signature motif containing protein [Brucella anthropi]|uniref:HNH endonuclease signature motif containing protein n=1 Tax=Brucella anthropi TaxID=529 RepID=UPI0005BA3F88|nr:HNH endonuclease signature motif containing protein [Brucella anthropi]KIU68403.1 hypothetical protein TR92_11040 [Brucella anthropi]
MLTQELTQEIVHELITYDPHTGKCFWKHRDIKWFPEGGIGAHGKWVRWNKKCAGKELNCVSHGYLRARFLGHEYRLHRVIWLYMTGLWPEQVDHINGVPDDNRWVNLRNVDQCDNMLNRQIGRHNTSGKMGVSWHKKSKRWVAKITIRGKVIHLGSYRSKDDAIASRDQAEIKYGIHPNHGRAA